MKSSARLLFAAIASFSAAGLVLSASSLQRHYASSATSFCDLGQEFNCDIVNRSEYASIAGIPVAAIGVAGYGLLLFFSTLRRDSAISPSLLLLSASAGLAFALYLTYIEAYVLDTWCILCLASLFVIFTITVLAFILKWRTGPVS